MSSLVGPRSRASPGRCGAERAWADVESSEPGPMYSRSGPGRCGAERAQVDVEPSVPRPMWS